MVIPSAGQIVILPFPFSDLSASKIRPAAVLARANKNDWILCQITSNAYGDTLGIELAKEDFDSGMLQLTSYARPTKLFTANSSLFLSVEGLLSKPKLIQIRQVVIRLFS